MVWSGILRNAWTDARLIAPPQPCWRMWQTACCAQNNCAHVDIIQAVEPGRSHVKGDQFLRAPSVVHQDVQPAQWSDGPIHEGAAIPQLGEIRLAHGCPGARRAAGPRGLLDTVEACRTVEGDIRTLPCELRCDFPPDTRSSNRNQCLLTN
jgi:hypothetical protein